MKASNAVRQQKQPDDQPVARCQQIADRRNVKAAGGHLGKGTQQRCEILVADRQYQRQQVDHVKQHKPELDRLLMAQLMYFHRLKQYD
jgi:hypothetical protein